MGYGCRATEECDVKVVSFGVFFCDVCARVTYLFHITSVDRRCYDDHLHGYHYKSNLTPSVLNFIIYIKSAL